MARQPSHARNLSLCNSLFAVDCRHGLWPAGARNATRRRCREPAWSLHCWSILHGRRIPSHRDAEGPALSDAALPRCSTRKSLWSRSQSISHILEINAFRANQSRVSCARGEGVWQETRAPRLDIHFTFGFLPTHGPVDAMMLHGPGVE